MAVNAVGNLLKSKAKVWIAPEGEAEPDETSVAYDGAWGGNWVNLGWTKEPLSFLYEIEEAEIEVEDYLGALDRWATMERVTLETVLAEAGFADTLAYASGTLDDTDVSTTASGAGQDGFDELEVGGVARLKKWAVGFEGVSYDSADNAQPLRVFLARATLRVNGELEFSQKSDDYIGIPLQVKALADSSNSGKMFKWQHVTAEAS